MAAPKSSTQKGPVRVRMYKGKEVKPCLYDGPHGKYMATLLNDQLLVDKSGRPIEFKKAGELVWVS